MELTEREKQIAKSWSDEQINEYGKLRSSGSNQLSAFYSANNLNKTPSTEAQEPKTLAQKVRGVDSPETQEIPVAQEVETVVNPNIGIGLQEGKSLVERVFRSGGNSLRDLLSVAAPVIPGGTGIASAVEIATGQDSGNPLTGVTTGIVKSAGDTLFGMGQLGTKIQKFIAGEGFKPDDIYIEGTEANKRVAEFIKAEGTDEEIGKFIGYFAQFAIPGSQVSRATQGANLLTRVGSQALTSGGIATAQDGGIGTDTAIATGAELAFPLAGRVVQPVIGLTKRLLRGLGSAFSGASTDVIEQIASNPQQAQLLTRELQKEGSAKIAENNARSIIQGIRDVQKEASADFGKALESLEQVPVSKKDLSTTMRSFADDFGITKQGDDIVIDGAEFFQTRNVNKAKQAVDLVDNIKDLSGKNIRATLKKVEDLKYRTSNTEEARAFNSFIDDLSVRLQDTISAKSPILQEANRNYAASKNLIEGANAVLGNTKYGGAKDIIKVSKGLDNLFKRNELSGKYLDEFLNKAGIDPQDFRTSEAVRQISDISQEANTVGGSLWEIIRTATSSVLTPKLIRDITIKSGLTEQALTGVLEGMTEPARKAFITALTNTEE